MTFFAGEYDIIVVGLGHAGIEAALAASRLGMRVAAFCTNLDAIGNLPCNPSIGGTAKGQLVREIDALGGEMARAADFASIQFRMLNRGKGPAVFSPRSQTDRLVYRAYMRRALEARPALQIIQNEVAGVLAENGAARGVITAGGAEYRANAVVLATGTYLAAKTFSGDVVRESGPDGLVGANMMSDCLRALGLPLRRFKTGTPPRIDGRTVDYSKFTPQLGDEMSGRFSFDDGDLAGNGSVCWLGYSNQAAHDVIRASLDRSPLFSGVIEGVGPRYCPSIEDKVVRFSDKTRHQLFLEPCGADTVELYVQGLSTSLPEDIQLRVVHCIEGLEHAVIMRPGYAIEYDCIDPLTLDATLAVMALPGLFAAGQLCGSSGYEEAAAQGLVAGINAARFVKGLVPFTLSRSDGYIGTLIDDLVTRGTDEPYRMMTSRCEHRLITRQDNADRRLMGYGFELGLVPEARVMRMKAEYAAADAEIERLSKTVAPPGDEVNTLLVSLGTAPLALSGASLKDLLRRPEITYDALASIDRNRPALSRKATEQVEISVKYEGYIRRQMSEVESARRMEDRALPGGIDYMSIQSIRTEARIKLSAVRPATLGQASRISGVSPSDIGALIVWLGNAKNS